MGIVLYCLNFWMVFCPFVLTFVFGAGEDDRFVRPWAAYLFPNASSWTEAAWVSFRTLPTCFPLVAFSHHPLRLGFLSCSTLVIAPLSTISFQTMKVSSSHRLIIVKSHRRLQSLITRLPIISNIFQIIQGQHSLKLNRILQFWFVKSFRDHYCGCFVCWQLSLVPSYVEILDIVVLQTYINRSDSLCSASWALVARKCS